MKAEVDAFNQEKALVGAFSVITNLRMELFEALVDSDQVQVPTWQVSRPRLHLVRLPPAQRKEEWSWNLDPSRVWRRLAWGGQECRHYFMYTTIRCSDFRLFIELFDATIHGPDLARVEGHGGKLHLLEHHLG